MQSRVINLLTKKARQNKNKIFGAVQPTRYLQKLNKQQVGQDKTVLITGASSGLGKG